MSFFNSLNVSASGLTAQRARMDVISQNIANANTTITPEGGAYRRQAVVLQSNPPQNFNNMIDQALGSSPLGDRNNRLPFRNEAQNVISAANQNGNISDFTPSGVAVQ